MMEEYNIGRKNMKKVVLLTLCICLMLAVLSGCGDAQRNEIQRNGVLIDDFIREYTSHKVSDYYEYSDIDYSFLYDVEIDEKERDYAEQHGGNYHFSLSTTLSDKTTAEMIVLVDKENYIEAIWVYFEENALGLFEHPKDLSKYYASILTSLNIGLNKESACEKVLQLFEQKGYEKHLDISDEVVLGLEVRNVLAFQVTFKY